MDVRQIKKDHGLYPEQIGLRMGVAAPECISVSGNLDILRNPCIGLICSIQCPGSIIIKTFDLIRRLRDKGVVIIGGFHSPMERECLEILLRGVQPIILCPAKSLYYLHMNKAARKAMGEGRLLVLSVFEKEIRRTTAPQGILRNDMVAAFAGALFVPYASGNGKTMATVNKALEYRQTVFTFEDEANANIIAAGAIVYDSDEFDTLHYEAKR
jgi:predicted Rossmann fold nucleotide-binding protein DprA/Smf involved in DNA uptake